MGVIAVDHWLYCGGRVGTGHGEDEEGRKVESGRVALVDAVEETVLRDQDRVATVYKSPRGCLRGSQDLNGGVGEGKRRR